VGREEKGVFGRGETGGTYFAGRRGLRAEWEGISVWWRGTHARRTAHPRMRERGRSKRRRGQRGQQQQTQQQRQARRRRAGCGGARTHGRDEIDEWTGLVCVRSRCGLARLARLARQLLAVWVGGSVGTRVLGRGWLCCRRRRRHASRALHSRGLASRAPQGKKEAGWSAGRSRRRQRCAAGSPCRIRHACRCASGSRARLKFA
jgi:hypothetical protein